MRMLWGHRSLLGCARDVFFISCSILGDTIQVLYGGTACSVRVLIREVTCCLQAPAKGEGKGGGGAGAKKTIMCSPASLHPLPAPPEP